MSGIYISGMEMPKDDMKNIMILADGRVFQFSGYGNPKPLGTAVLVPPHGRSIDADALWVEINKICDRRDAGIITDLTCVQQLLSAVRHAPTIIPADEGEEMLKQIDPGTGLTLEDLIDAFITSPREAKALKPYLTRDKKKDSPTIRRKLNDTSKNLLSFSSHLSRIRPSRC